MQHSNSIIKGSNIVARQSDSRIIPVQMTTVLMQMTPAPSTPSPFHPGCCGAPLMNELPLSDNVTLLMIGYKNLYLMFNCLT